MDSRTNDLSLLWHQRTTLKRGSKCKHTYLFRTTAWKVSKLIWSFHMFWLLPLPLLSICNWKSMNWNQSPIGKRGKIKSNCDKISFSGKSEQNRVLGHNFSCIGTISLHWNNFSCIGTISLVLEQFLLYWNKWAEKKYCWQLSQENQSHHWSNQIRPKRNSLQERRNGAKIVFVSQFATFSLYHNRQVFLFLCITIGKFFFVSELASFSLSLYPDLQVFICIVSQLASFALSLYHDWQVFCVIVSQLASFSLYHITIGNFFFVSQLAAFSLSLYHNWQLFMMVKRREGIWWHTNNWEQFPLVALLIATQHSINL